MDFHWFIDWRNDPLRVSLEYLIVLFDYLRAFEFL